MSVEKFVVIAALPDVGRRLDLFLASSGAGISRSQAQKLIEEGSVYINNLPCTRKNYRLRQGDKVTFFLQEPRPLLPRAEQIPLDIVFEDDDLLVINKPRGMVVHPAPGHSHGTLVNALLNHCNTLSTIGGPERPGIVHRLDKDTTGLLLVAKNDYSHKSLAAQLQSRTIRREYLALV
ncbi:MAG: pseudouridine synthase, partial [Dethiobacteria bacterium]